MEKAFAIWCAFQDRILGRVAAVILLGCMLLALVEIFRRYVLGLSFEWQQDAVTFFILSSVYLYFSISQRHDEHLGVTVVPEVLNAMGPRAQHAAEVVKLIALVFSCAFLIAVVWWGIPEIVDGYRYEARTESLAFPMWPFLVVLLLGFAFMAITMFFQVYRSVHKLRGREVLVEPPSGDSVLH